MNTNTQRREERTGEERGGEEEKRGGEERNAVTTGQFGPIGLLNVEGKILFSVATKRLVFYLKAIRLIEYFCAERRNGRISWMFGTW